MRKILILESGDKSYRSLFEEHGEIITAPYEVEDCDLVVFTGGPDVNPSIYGDIKLDTTHIDTNRDQLEWRIYNMAYMMAIPMVGICRGMQFLNVMNGGLLIQDVNNHTNCIHSITTHEEETFEVNGDHHQMCIPQGYFERLAWVKNLSDHYTTGQTFDVNLYLGESDEANYIQEPEALFWPNSNSLGVQYHPEWMDEDSRGYEYFQELLNKYIFNQE